MRRTTVRDVMTTGVLSVGPDAPFREVATTLFAGAVRAVPVLDADGLLLGVISEADLLATAERLDPAPEYSWWRPRPRHIGRPGPQSKAGASTARELMSAPAVTVAPTATVAAAARAMREQRLSWLPVTDTDGRVLGVLGRSDLLAVFLRDDAEIRAEVVDGVLVGMLLVDPMRVSVGVVDGVVTIAGQLDTRTDAELAVRFVERLEGVVGVVDRLTYVVDAHDSDLDVAPLY
jgi:CBS-domain-containing membrane protein